MFKKKSLVITPVETTNVFNMETPKEDTISWGAHVSVLMEQATKAGLILMAAQTARGILTHIVVTKIK